MRSRTASVWLALVVMTVCSTASAATAWAGFPAPSPGQQIVTTPGGDQFYNYDYDTVSTFVLPNPAWQGYSDWPVTIIFTGNASVTKVRSLVAGLLPSVGSPMHARLSDLPCVWEWVGHLGRKQTAFYLSGLQIVPRPATLHIRLYAHWGAKSYDPVWGNYVLCTTHYDYNEFNQILGMPQFSGYSESAAAAVVAWFEQRGCHAAGVWDCKNASGGMPSPPTHLWQCDGMATLIAIP